MSEHQKQIDTLRAEREHIATGVTNLNAEQRQKRIRELSHQIRTLEGPPQAFSRSPGMTTFAMTPTKQ